MNTVIFACVHNAGRSQMAAHYFNRLADPTKARALSAGTQPAQQVNPVVVAAMAEEGIDLSGVVPQRLTLELARGATRLFTMGCDECPEVPGVPVVAWKVPDPRNKGLDAVRAIREEVRGRIERLLAQEGWANPS